MFTALPNTRDFHLNLIVALTIMADVLNFTNVQPQIQVGSVVYGS